MLGEDAEAERTYKKLEMVPEPLTSTDHPVPKTVITAYIARKNYLTEGGHKKAMQKCELASQMLADSIAYSSCKKKDKMVTVSFFLLVLFQLFPKLWALGVHCSCIACFLKGAVFLQCNSNV